MAGRVVEEATTRNCWRRKGFYARLHSRQFRDD
jgi:hypothetical protein